MRKNILFFVANAVLLNSAFASTMRKQKPDAASALVTVQSGDDTEILGLGKDQSLPLGVPVEFETPLFKGSVLLRFRHAKSDDPKSHQEYFDGRKRLMQTVVQGRFKRAVKMDDVYFGGIFKKPFPKGPPPSWTKMIYAVFRRIAPGIILDLASNKPKVISLYAGTAQTISIDKPGSEPDIKAPNLLENVASHFGDNFKSSDKRKKILSIPDEAAKYEFDTNHIYTFESYDDVLDFAKGSIRLPVYGDYDIKPAIGSQPLSLCAVTKGGEVFYSFQIWPDGAVKQ